jgi:8-oxo-dGTP diphosphatase
MTGRDDRGPGRPVAVAVDVVLLSLDRDGRPVVVLAPPRAREPYRGDWALPGRRVRPDEDLEVAARSVLRETAGSGHPRHLEQVATFGRPDRDPRGRVVSVSYLALQPAPTPLPADARWTPVDEAHDLAFDHDEILAGALGRLRAKLSYSTVAFGLLPDEFALSDLQAVYESLLGRVLDKRNFRRKLLALGVLEETGAHRRGAHRPAQLYRFAHEGLVILDDALTAPTRTRPAT